MKRLLLLGGILLAGGVAFAQVQGQIQSLFTGNECWNSGQGAGGFTGGFLCLNQTSSIQSAVTNTTTTSFTLPSNIADTILTGTVGSINITFPPNASTGSISEVVNGTGSAFVGTLTFVGNTNQTIVGGTTAVNLASGGSAEFRFVVTNTGTNPWTGVWYRVR